MLATGFRICGIKQFPVADMIPVITSYSIHYTKLYEMLWWMVKPGESWTNRFGNNPLGPQDEAFVAAE